VPFTQSGTRGLRQDLSVLAGWCCRGSVREEKVTIPSVVLGVTDSATDTLAVFTCSQPHGAI
jgi:hypothetical protein